MGKLIDNHFRLENVAGKAVTGPDGAPLSIADLPPPNTRWVIRRKAEVVAAVRGGLLSIDEACKRYFLSVDEFLSWQRAIDKQGLGGLRAKEMHSTRRSQMEVSDVAEALAEKTKRPRLAREK